MKPLDEREIDNWNKNANNETLIKELVYFLLSSVHEVSFEQKSSLEQKNVTEISYNLFIFSFFTSTHPHGLISMRDNRCK